MGDPSQQYGTDAAESYGDSADWPVRRWAEFPTFLAGLGPITGKTVLDLACGTGIVSRMIAELGAARVVGVDSSEAMIAEARAAGDYDGRVEYRVSDVTAMAPQGDFDIVTTAWLFSYAANREQFEGFFARVAENLRPGGHLVATVANPDLRSQDQLDPRYGLTLELPPEFTDGAPYTATFHTSPPLTVQVFYWSREAYGSALHGAGFSEVSFNPWRPNEEGIQQMGAEFWQPLLVGPLGLILTCRKDLSRLAAKGSGLLGGPDPCNHKSELTSGDRSR